MSSETNESKPMMEKPGGFKSDLKKMLPVWIVITLTAVGSLAAVRMSGVKYLQEGIYSHADTCQVGEVHFQAGKAIWQRLAHKLVVERQSTRAASSLGELKGQKELEQARERLEEAIRVCPRILGAHELLADIAWWSGNQAQTHYHLGMEHLQKRELNPARVELETALDLEPSTDAFKMALLDVVAQQERWEDARALLADAPSDITESPVALRIQAQVAAQDGNFEESIAYLEQALTDRPGYHPYVSELISLYHKTETFSRTDWLSENIDQAVAPEASDYHNLAMLYTRAGEDKKALDAIEKGLAIQNNSVLLTMEKALAQYRLGQVEQARFTTEEAIDKDPQEFMRILADERFDTLSKLRE